MRTSKMYEWKATNAIYLDDEVAGKGRQFKCRFLVPGLVKYDYGVCLLTKENADKFIQGFIGCPVVINHQDVTDANAKDVSVGNIFSVWFDEKDGYYWCNGIITDKHAIELIDKGYSVSCQYTITEYSDNVTGALHNGNPYDKVIEDGKPEHLAIVNNPRYEGAIIAVNAINVTEKEEEDVNKNLITDNMTASNSFEEQFKDTLYTVLAEGISNRLGELIASNEDKWITIHPHGDDSEDYRRLKLKDGESPKEAMQRMGWYEKRKAKDEKQKKLVEEKIKELQEKAKKVGGEKTVLGQKYLTQIKELQKGNIGVKEDEEKETAKDTPKELKSSKHFEKFNKLLDDEKKAHDEWAAKQKEYNEALENNKEYQELEKKITELRRQLMSMDYREKEKYLALQADKNALQKKQNEIRGNIEKKVGLYAAQNKWSEVHSAKDDEQKNLIKSSSNDIKQQLSKISSRNDSLVKKLETLKNDPYIEHINKMNSLKKEYENLFETYRNMEWGTEEYKAGYQKYRDKLAEYQTAYWKSKTMLAEFAPKVSKMLQVENGMKFETTAKNEKMEENAKRLKEVLNGIIPDNVLDNRPINIHQTGAVRASQSGQSINLHNNERIGTIIHETAHQLEENNPQMLINSLAFAKSRTEGEKQKALNKIASGYRRDEYCKPDKFFDPYCGKLYTLFGGRDRSFVDGTASEIMSMGLQHLFEDPINFAKEDREYFDFVISNLRGELWD